MKHEIANPEYMLEHFRSMEAQINDAETPREADVLASKARDDAKALRDLRQLVSQKGLTGALAELETELEHWESIAAQLCVDAEEQAEELRDAEDDIARYGTYEEQNRLPQSAFL